MLFHLPHFYATMQAEVHWDDNLFPLDGFSRPGRVPDHVMMSPGVDVDILPERPVDINLVGR